MHVLSRSASLLTSLVPAIWSRVVVVPVLIALAEHDLRRGRFLAARRRFLRAAARGPASFRAHFGLARVYFQTGDVALARRELVVARQLAPARFREVRRQLPQPYRDEEHVVLPAEFREVPLAGTDAVDDPSVDLAAGSDGGASAPGAYGDCRDRAEWEQFQARGAIRPEEAADVDWDRLLSEIGRSDG